MRVRLSDGKECEVSPGEVAYLRSSHDAWIVGNEPIAAIDWAGASNYAKG